MQTVSFEEVLEHILAKYTRFHRDAFHFVKDALDFTQKIVGKEAKGGGIRHVTGQELLAGIREHALQQFGPMTTTVFEEWGIHSCQDFGEIVFLMVEHNLLAKTETETDSRADFLGGYDFFEAFRQPFLPSRSRTPARPKVPTKV
jgi:uncharacterized repeat protein (TIGR04138 family)